MAKNTLKQIPVQLTEFKLVETRVKELNKFYKEYMDILLKVQPRTIATGNVVASDIPDAPPAITYP